MGHLDENAIHPKPDEFTTQQIMDDPILRYFHYKHLPPVLQEVSSPFCALAEFLVTHLPRNPERTVALRKLLEAKDAGVRANVGAAPAARKETFYDRLLAESKELEEKRDKLAKFFGTNAFLALGQYDQTLLRNQDTVMAEYAAILGQRIATIKPSASPREFEQVGEIKTTGGNHSETPIPFEGE